MTDDDDIRGNVAKLAELILQEGLSEKVRRQAKEASKNIGLENIDELKHLFHNPPQEPEIYDVTSHGFGGWLSACQFSAFEMIFNLGEPALPFLREIAWGPYDWTQGNAIEIMIRLAAKGIQRDEIIEEITAKFPTIRYEAQLYALEPLMPRLEADKELKSVIDRLAQCPDFKDRYDELMNAD